jgi:hypothetical protein
VAAQFAALCWAGCAVATAPPGSPAPSTTVADDGLVPPDSEAPVEVPPPIDDPVVKSAPLVVLPAGCTAAPSPVAVFVGAIVASDATTARFTVLQLRAGSLDGYAVGSLVDVRYDDDIRFLHTGQQYLVGAAPDPLSGRLQSKVRSPAPLFGGDAVIGINDSDVSCPPTEDGILTLHVDGAGVDTGVLAPLKTAKRSLLRAVAKPMVIGLAVLVALVAIKLLAFAMVRALREYARDDDLVPLPQLERGRRHEDGEDQPASELTSGRR